MTRAHITHDNTEEKTAPDPDRTYTIQVFISAEYRKGSMIHMNMNNKINRASTYNVELCHVYMTTVAMETQRCVLLVVLNHVTVDKTDIECVVMKCNSVFPLYCS